MRERKERRKGGKEEGSDFSPTPLFQGKKKKMILFLPPEGKKKRKGGARVLPRRSAFRSFAELFQWIGRGKKKKKRREKEGDSAVRLGQTLHTLILPAKSVKEKKKRGKGEKKRGEEVGTSNTRRVEDKTALLTL